jgi:hypothetical protein
MSSQQRVSPDQKMRPEYVDNLVASDLVGGMYDEDDLPQPILDLLHKDFPLANIRGDDREHFRLLADNIKILVQELFAPEGSRMTGVVGQALLEDPSYDGRSLSRQERVRLQTVLLDHYARSSRGVGGWQQDKLSETINTSRVEDARETEESPTIFGGLFA